MSQRKNLAGKILWLGDVQEVPLKARLKAVLQELMEKRGAAKRKYPLFEVDPYGCWVSLGRNRKKTGYKGFTVDGQEWLMHRWFYLQFNGPLDSTLTIDHTCRNRGCVNPEHLEQVTHLVNVQRAAGFPRKKTTHCFKGHFREGKSYCRICHNERERERKRRMRSKVRPKDG